ncbi:MAG: NAD(P)-binding protein [Flavobacteriales bacterium]|nr:NAD(P)-binding protein [Flavobacteriales bacterium]MCX7649352.1 NAD(P)-binding protein [Flavobacteriales bacterium]MDW8432775.1 NAD(P)-binding protein [Flavobacteriales bacterium]
MRYDVGIVGSGIGGLLVGAFLAKEGFKVAVFEKNRQFGGALQIFSRSKKIIDTGIHYIGGLDEGQNLHLILSYLGVFKPEDFIRLDPDCFDGVWPGGEFCIYPLAQGFDNFARVLSDFFPSEKSALRRYAAVMQEVTQSAPLFHLQLPADTYLSNPYLGMAAYEYIDQSFKDPLLKKVLAGNSLIYDGRSAATSFYTHAMTMASYVQSAWRPRKGSHTLATGLVKAIQSWGGQLFNYSEIHQILNQTSGAWRVCDLQKRVFECQRLVMAVHPTVVARVVPSECLPPSFRRKVRLGDSSPSLTLHLALKPGTIPYRNHNIYGNPCGEVWNGAARNPFDHWGMFWTPDEAHPGYASVINVLTYCPEKVFQKWQSTFRTQPHYPETRDPEYEALKSHLAEEFLESLPEALHITSESIASVSVSTPLTWRDYIGSPNGSMYGILKDYHRPGNGIFSPVIIPDRLYYTGQNMNLHGVTGTALSALLTAGAFIGLEHLLKRIRTEA